MRGRTGFALGVAVGYALGAKGGRQWYEQFKNLAAPPPVAAPAPPVLEEPVSPRSKVQQLIGDGLRASSKMLRER
jgi:hypothetical protein